MTNQVASKYSRLFHVCRCEYCLGAARVTTRIPGDIPGCVPAVDVLRPIQHSTAQALVMREAIEYCHRMWTMDFQDFKNWRIPSHHSPIANPAPAVRGNYLAEVILS